METIYTNSIKAQSGNEKLMLNIQNEVESIIKKRVKSSTEYHDPKQGAIHDKSSTRNTDNTIEIAQNINSFLESIQTDLKVEIHKETHTPIFKVVRRQDAKVIREVPPRELLDIEVKIKDMVGSLFDKSV